jgi:hypothetical protein
MSEAQWPHTLHISLNQEKQVSLVLFFGGGGASIKASPLPPLEFAGTTNGSNSFPSLCELSPTPLCEVYLICEKSKLGLSEILFVST